MDTDTEVVWYLVSESGEILAESNDIIDCVDTREGVNTETHITDTEPT
jgi:glutaredoxin 2